MSDMKKLAAALALAAAAMVTASNAEAQCASDRDCRGGRVCRLGACTSSCAKDVDCPDGQVCDAGACQAVPGTSDSDVREPASHAASPSPDPGLPPASPEPIAPSPGPLGLPPETAPPQYTVQTEGKTGLIIAGAVTLGTTYTLGIVGTAIIAAAMDSDYPGETTGIMAIPLAGPWIGIGMGEDLGKSNPDFAGGYAGAGLLQLGGLTMLVLGLVLRDEVQVPTYALGDAPDEQAPLWLGPAAAGGDSFGMSLGIGPRL